MSLNRVLFVLYVRDEHDVVHAHHFDKLYVDDAIAALKKAIERLEAAQLPSTAHFFPEEK